MSLLASAGCKYLVASAHPSTSWLPPSGARILDTIMRTLVTFMSAAALIGVGTRQPKPTFAADLAFLEQHSRVVVLGNAPGPQVVVAPEYQGRVMTSTTGERDAPGFGWIGKA